MTSADPVGNGGAASRRFRPYAEAYRTSMILTAATIFAVFLPALVVPYAYSDDYPLLAMATALRPVRTSVTASSRRCRPVDGRLRA